MASANFNKGDYITSYPGKNISNDDELNSSYIIQAGPDSVIDAKPEVEKIDEDPSRQDVVYYDFRTKSTGHNGSAIDFLGAYINHSCFPNAQIVVPNPETTIDEISHAYVQATRPIEKGTQVFVDYGSNFAMPWLNEEQQSTINTALRVRDDCLAFLEGKARDAVLRARHINAGNNDTYRVIYANGHVDTLRVFYPRAQAEVYSIVSPFRSATCEVQEMVRTRVDGQINVSVNQTEAPVAFVISECVDVNALSEDKQNVVLDEFREKNVLRNAFEQTSF